MDVSIEKVNLEIMSSGTFINLIQFQTTISPEQLAIFQRLLSVKELKAGKNFVSIGQLPKTIAYVKSGLFRYYYINESGREFTKGFFTENSIIISFSAIVEQRPSYYAIEALEDSIIEEACYQEFIELYKKDPCWNEFLIRMLQKGYMAKEERERELLLFDAEQRYNSFRNRYPGLEKRIKQNLIASYLGIAPESLSRLKKKMTS